MCFFKDIEIYSYMSKCERCPTFDTDPYLTLHYVFGMKKTDLRDRYQELKHKIASKFGVRQESFDAFVKEYDDLFGVTTSIHHVGIHRRWMVTRLETSILPNTKLANM